MRIRVKSLLEMGFKGLNNCIASSRGNIHCASGLRGKKKLTHKSVEAKMLDRYHPEWNRYKVPRNMGPRQNGN